MANPPASGPPTFPCPACTRPVPVGQVKCPNPNCKEDLTSLAMLDTLGTNLYVMALDQVRGGHRAEAIKTLETATDFEPGHVDAWVVLGKLYAQARQYDEAIRRWERALALRPDETRAQAGIRQASKHLSRRLTRRRVFLSAAAVIALALGLFIGGFAFRPPAPLPPSVAAALAADPALAGLNVQVQEDAQGIVLSGSVPSDLQRQWIMSLARHLAPQAEIRAEDLQVELPPDLVSRVQGALAAYPLTASLQLGVSQRGEAIILRGTVASAEGKQAAERIARGVSGVMVVDSTAVSIQPPALVEAVRASLQREPLLADAILQVSQIGDGIQLSGTVTAFEIKAQAEKAAGAVTGVAWVDSRGMVVQPVSLEVIVSSALKADPRTADLSIGVKQIDSGILLTGEILRPELEQAAAEVVRAVPGVAMVDTSELVVRRETVEYTVRPNDTLSQIASEFYGAWWLWPVIYEANRDRLANPTSLAVGQVILLPLHP